MSATEVLCGTPVTITHVEQVLKKTFNTQHTIVSYEATKISEGKSFLSDIIRIQLTWNRPNQRFLHNSEAVKKSCKCTNRSCHRLPSSVIAKVPCINKLQIMFNMMNGGDDMQAIAKAVEKLDIVKRASHTEIAAYTMLTTHHVPVKITRYYGASLPDNDEDVPAFLLFKDLSGCASPSLHGLNAGQLEALAMTLADLHAWSVAHRDVWANKECFLTRFDQLFNTEDIAMKSYEEFCKFITENKNIREMLGGDAVCKRTDVLRMSSEDYKMMENMHEHPRFTSYGIPTVLVQGDCWSNNMLFNRLANGEAGDHLIAIIDWQGCHAGSPFEDFCKVLTFATPPDVRRHAWPRIFGMYYERLRTHLQSYGKELQPTREQMWQVCEHSLAKFAAFTVCFVPKWLNVRKGMMDTIDADSHEQFLLEKARALWEDLIDCHGRRPSLTPTMSFD